MIPVDNNWFGRCLSVDSGISYHTPDECDENAYTLLKIFNAYNESIEDFVNFILTVRRSDSGPFKYNVIVDDMDYKSALNKLSRLGFNSEFMYYQASYFFNTCVAIIENSGIYEWDDEVKDMSKRRNRNNSIINQAEAVAETSVETEVAEEPSHMYRVRLEWEKPDTQIFASPNYENAKSKALEHEGYKIFIDDDGEIFEDPWKKDEDAKPVTVDTTIPGVKEVIHPYQGKAIDLHNTPIYRTASDKMYFKQLSGRFYFYDNTIVNGRAKITATQHMVKKNPSYILGYINVNE